MKIKESDYSRKIFTKLFQLLPMKKGVIVLVLYSCLLFFLGAVAHKNDFTGRVIKPILSVNYRLPYNFIKGMFSNPEKIFIDIKFKDFQKLAYLRGIALERGRIITTQNSYVPATVRVGTKVVKADIRLKGDLTDHVEGDKWSLRIKVTGDDSILGMKRFSLQDPRLSGHLFEWVVYKLYKYEGLIALRYEYVDVMINGKKMGIYALEESFSNELIENNGRREGPIIKFDESQLHDGTRWNSGTVRSKSDIFFNSNIEAFRSKKTKSDSGLYVNYLIAKKILEKFRAGKIRASQAFDVEQAAKLYAIANLLSNSAHALWWKNVRFYYNPIISKLELIGYNAYGSRHYTLSEIKDIIWRDNYPESPNQFIVNEYHNLFFTDSVFVDFYLKTLDRISKNNYLNNFFQSIEHELRKNIAIIYRDRPTYTFTTDVYYNNQSFIHGILNPALPISAKIKVNSSLRTDGLKILVANTGFLPIEVISIESVDTGVELLDGSQTLPGKIPSKALHYHELNLEDHSKSISKTDISKGVIVRYHIIGLERLHSATVSRFALSEHTNVLSNEQSDRSVTSSDMLKINDQNRSITIQSGIWNVTQDVIIPVGYKVICGEATKINLLKSSKLLSYSPIIFRGSEKNPIIITSSDSTGQGMFVLETKEKSFLEHVHFNNLCNPSQHGWELTSAVTFYEADVSINHCIFSNNRRGDDYINMVRSKFDITNTLFCNIYADALDSDFCEGSITNTAFATCGNDGIDISGSRINIDNVFMDSIGDKGLSAGENSQMIIKHIRIVNSEIAICSKDKSDITIDNAILEDNKIGFTAFQKKSEFGPGNINVSELEMKENAIPYLIETRSSLTIAGKIRESDSHEVKAMLYGVKYGKSSE